MSAPTRAYPRRPNRPSFKLSSPLRFSNSRPESSGHYEASNGQRVLDGGLVANNPSALALAEASLLWPGKPVDVVVSLGAGIETPKRRAAGGMLDLAAYLLESSTSSAQIDMSLRTALSYASGVHYFRFEAVHNALNIEIDETDEGKLKRSVAAADAYLRVPAVAAAMVAACKLLSTAAE